MISIFYAFKCIKNSDLSVLAIETRFQFVCYLTLLATGVKVGWNDPERCSGTFIKCVIKSDRKNNSYIILLRDLIFHVLQPGGASS